MLLRPDRKSPVRAAITGVHGYLPDYVLTNDELSRMVDTSDAWIIERTGIKERRIQKGEGLGTSHMAVEAVRGLLEKTGTRPEEIDVLVCATITPDFVLPSTANLICDMVGMRHIGSFDIQAACSGFVYGLDVASQFIETGRAKKAILVGADKMSTLMTTPIAPPAYCSAMARRPYYWSRTIPARASSTSSFIPTAPACRTFIKRRVAADCPLRPRRSKRGCTTFISTARRCSGRQSSAWRVRCARS